ncbi:MAG TPA: aminotransferase class IV [Candidatus Limnocylindria bacterium]|nr:aminotransferase class IV [Candidatus Limnocylindria bacterium]
MLVWLNGRILDARAARVSALDRGLLHGDGLYDTWRTYAGRSFAAAAHLRRMAAAARWLGLPPPSTAAAWSARAERLAARNGLRDAAVRLTMTRGATGDGVLPARDGPPTLLLTVRALPADLALQQARGIACVLLPFPRDAGFPWGTMKLVGHASAVVGRRLAVRRRAAEGLYVTRAGEVTEGTTSNLFVVERDTLLTPPRTSGVLGGVTRDLVLRLANSVGLRAREEPLTVARVRRAAELFVTASTVELLPVVRLDGRPLNSGTPGPATRALQAAYRAHVRRALYRQASRRRSS